MKVNLACVGKISETWMRTGIDDYANRIKRYLPFSEIELKEEKGGGKKSDPRFIKDREGERILGRIPDGAFVLALDERGVRLGSEELAGLLEKHMIHGTTEMIPVIGGAFGLCDTVKRRSDLCLSLSPMTFTHQMARLFFTEQLYRALTIIRNEPYHNR